MANACGGVTKPAERIGSRAAVSSIILTCFIVVVPVAGTVPNLESIPVTGTDSECQSESRKVVTEIGLKEQGEAALDEKSQGDQVNNLSG